MTEGSKDFAIKYRIKTINTDAHHFHINRKKKILNQAIKIKTYHSHDKLKCKKSYNWAKLHI